MAGRYSDNSGFEDLLHCMICFEYYRSPKMLQCGHTFCEECLQGYQRTYEQQKRAQPGKLPCPTCRELTSLPANGVAGLKNDFKVKKIELMFKTVNLRGKAASRTCDSCKSQKKDSTAQYYCTNCGMNYCDSCLRRHNKNPILTDHQVLNKSKERPSDFFCKLHKGEGVKFFCRTCQTVACTLCVMHDHERHDVMEITKTFVSHQTEIQNLIQTVQERMVQLKNKANELESLRKLNLQSCQQAEIGIKERTLELIDSLRKQEKDLLADVTKKRDGKLKKIKDEYELVMFHVAKATSLQEFAQSTMSKKNNMKFIAVHEDLIQRLKTVAEVDSSLPDNGFQTVTTFLPSREKPILGRLDDIRANASAPNALPVSPSPRRSSRPTVTALQDRRQSSAKMLMSIQRVGNGLGELRDPLGVACLPTGEIIVAEWGNKRLQMFDSVGQSIRAIGMGELGPQGMTMTWKGNIAVTDESHKRIEVFKPNGETISKWGLGRFYSPCGIAVSPNGNFVVTDSAEHTVSVYQGEKNMVKRWGSRGTRSDQFDNPLYVACNGKNDIFVSDSDNHCIKVFDSAGRFKYKFGSEGKGNGELKFPRGICVDKDGYIIVADRNNDRVSMFTPNGDFVKHLLTSKDKVRDPYAVAISPTRNLIITECNAGRAALKMFQL